MIDPLQQVRLLRARGDGHSNEAFRQADVGKDAGGVVVEVEEGARLQGEDARAHLAERRTSAKLLEERRDPEEGVRTRVPHG